MRPVFAVRVQKQTTSLAPRGAQCIRVCILGFGCCGSSPLFIFLQMAFQKGYFSSECFGSRQVFWLLSHQPGTQFRHFSSFLWLWHFLASQNCLKTIHRRVVREMLERDLDLQLRVHQHQQNWLAGVWQDIFYIHPQETPQPQESKSYQGDPQQWHRHCCWRVPLTPWDYNFGRRYYENWIIRFAVYFQNGNDNFQNQCIRRRGGPHNSKEKEQNLG